MSVVGPLASTPVSYKKTPSRQVSLRPRLLTQKSSNAGTPKSAKPVAAPGDSLVLARLRRRESLYRSLSLSNSASLNHFSPILPKLSSPPCRTRREEEKKERRKSLPVQKVEKDVQTGNILYVKII